MGIVDSRGFGCVVVVVILLCICLGTYLVTSALMPDQPRSTQTASARCIGLLNIGSCNVTQTSYRPAPHNDGMTKDALLALFAVLAMLFLALATTGGNG